MTHLNSLRSRIVLLRRRVVEEKDGSFTEKWEEGDAVWAQVLPCSVRDSIGEGWNNLNPSQGKYKVTLRFRLRRFSRVKWEGTTLSLLSPPLIDERRQWITCFMYDIGEENE
ncbi:MAG: head-tail adaptor protein [Alphaproteobacteria bacterium]|jgi:head-tail adaptor|nr:head-tail adaptor protein [Alphaproteobacteria bacterium]